MPPRNSAIRALPNTPPFDFVRERSKDAVQPAPERLLALDPGETLGWSIAKQGNFYIAGQIPKVHFYNITELLEKFQPTLVVMESYRLYPWKAQEQGFSDFFTPRLIGAIEDRCWQAGVPRAFQSASQGKSFVTDEKLRGWGYYIRGKPHANDATRHLCQYLLFGKGVGTTLQGDPHRHKGE
jgi:hypothetical protein